MTPIGFGDESLRSSGTWPSGRSSSAIVVVMVAVLYYATPNVKQPKFRSISVGAAVAIGIWVLASTRLRVLREQLQRYNALYGSVGGIIVFLLWLWLTNLALLVGAEIDAERGAGARAAGRHPGRADASS